MKDLNRSQPPKADLGEGARDLARVWSEMAKVAADIAHSRRTLFLAYVAEGFSDAQAMELVKSI
ncbi:hypothetical protein [Sphingopyxis indica]|uniref:MarR family transcriptional regulator n=1 Tax=Sphingopyxis indica TaxID=436663 RepID=A0A239KNZ0_9SPHN|nr:hypothetical protein [Sphingopyxis indica]SNT19785.1 hypothetical protein SAMN06295955_11575 [Sphingopyxis indica]